MLASPQPGYIGWGKELCALYNDAFIPILCTKHPAALGLPFEDLWSEIAPSTRGAYINHLDGDESPLRVRQAYGPNWDRLVVLKQRYEEFGKELTVRYAEGIDSIEGDAATALQGQAAKRDFWSALQPHHTSVYVNFLMEEGEERIRQAYGAEKYDRLKALKRKYDPGNLFRLNQNIPPD